MKSPRTSSQLSYKEQLNNFIANSDKDIFLRAHNAFNEKQEAKVLEKNKRVSDLKSTNPHSNIKNNSLLRRKTSMGSNSTKISKTISGRQSVLSELINHHPPQKQTEKQIALLSESQYFEDEHQESPTFFQNTQQSTNTTNRPFQLTEIKQSLGLSENIKNHQQILHSHMTKNSSVVYQQGNPQTHHENNISNIKIKQHFLESPEFSSFKSDIQIGQTITGLIFGIIENHGVFGVHISNHFQQNFTSQLQAKLSKYEFPLFEEQQVLCGLITQTFRQLYKDLLELNKARLLYSGSTISLCIVVPQKFLMVANIGNHHILLGSYHKFSKFIWETNRLTSEHTPCEKAQSERIIKSGGKIFKGKEGDVTDTTLKIWGMPDTGEGDMSSDTMYGIVTTRSFGDECLSKIGVLSAPDVKYCRLTANNKIIFMANSNFYLFFQQEETMACLSFFYDNDRDVDSAYLAIKRQLQKMTSYGDWTEEDFCFFIAFLE